MRQSSTPWPQVHLPHLCGHCKGNTDPFPPHTALSRSANIPKRFHQCKWNLLISDGCTCLAQRGPVGRAGRDAPVGHVRARPSLLGLTSSPPLALVQPEDPVQERHWLGLWGGHIVSLGCHRELDVPQRGLLWGLMAALLGRAPLAALARGFARPAGSRSGRCRGWRSRGALGTPWHSPGHGQQGAGPGSWQSLPGSAPAARLCRRNGSIIQRLGSRCNRGDWNYPQEWGTGSDPPGMGYRE